MRSSHADSAAILWRRGWRPGVQLAAAVAAAWLVSAALGLPESFWAVMSVLIVMRPSAGSTLDAGWGRVRGTALGALFGLGGVYLQRHGVNALAGTLSIVTLLAFACAAVPALRSAPVAALIILSAGGIPGHSALQVALLRLAQIGIGVGVALAVSTVASEYRAGARFDEGCTRLLRRVAQRMAALGGDGPAPTEAEAARGHAAARDSLARLTALAGSADLEARWWRRSGVAMAAAAADADATPQTYRRRARLTARILQDAALLDRVFRRVPHGAEAGPLWREAARTASAALADVVEARAAGQGATADLAPLGRLAAAVARRKEGSDTATVLLAAPLALLLEDLRRFNGL